MRCWRAARNWPWWTSWHTPTPREPATRVLTHGQILREVWGPGYTEQTHYLRVYMAHLRSKLEAVPASPKLLLTEPGVGYRLAVRE
jgi:two-component system KDP operon response regulator KdpE